MPFPFPLFLFPDIGRDVNVFIFQKNDRSVMKTTKKIENEMFVFENDRFLKSSF